MFQGTSAAQMEALIGTYPFHFLKYGPGEAVVRAGEPCSHLKSLISGEVEMSITSPEGRFRVASKLKAPATIAPDFFFGRSTAYPCEVVVPQGKDSAGIVQLDKADYLKIVVSNPVVLLNCLNLLSKDAQTAVQGVMWLTGGDLTRRIAYWMLALTQTGASDIRLQCRQRDLYAVFGVPRQSLVAALELMREMGLVEFSSTEVRLTASRRDLGEML